MTHVSKPIAFNALLINRETIIYHDTPASGDLSTIAKRDDLLVHIEALNPLHYSFFLNKDVIDIIQNDI